MEQEPKIWQENPDVDPQVQLKQMRELLQEKQRYLEKIERLMAALTSNNGLQYLVDEAYGVLGNPILVVDSSFCYIAHSLGEEGTAPFPEVFREELEHGCVLESGIAYIRKERLDQITSERTTPYYQFNDLLQCGCYISSVRIHGIEVAHITLLERNHPFTDTDYRCFLKLVDFTAQEVQKNSFYAGNKGQLFSYLLRDLLESEHPNEESILRRLDILKYPLGRQFRMAVILNRDEEHSVHSLELLESQLHPILSGNIYAFYENSLVVFFNHKQKDEATGRTESALRECARRSGCSVGLSHNFESIVAVHRYYQQALRAAQLGRGRHMEGGLFFYQDYIWADMLELCRGSRKLIEFCHPGILRLLEHDKENDSQLLLTLYVYLENPFNPTKVSGRLFIHKNTMFYRLEKIRTILGTNLKNGREMFQFHLSFRVLQYLDLFTPPTYEEEDSDDQEAEK